MSEFPKIVSVDDHVVEPPDTWSSRLPKKYADVGPRIVYAPAGEVVFKGGKLSITPGKKGEGPEAAFWFYEELRRPLMRNCRSRAKRSPGPAARPTSPMMRTEGSISRTSIRYRTSWA